jgi:nucleotide-binding universal stress UspA family protein
VKLDPILFCYDGSNEAQRSIEIASELLGLRPAVVVDVGAVLTGAESLAALSPGVDLPALQVLNRQAAQERADSGVSYARRFGYDAEAREVLAEPVWEGILEVADDVNASVIVVGSRGLNHARAVVEGSLSRALAEHSTRPLLIVPPDH